MWKAVRGTLQHNFSQRVGRFDAKKVSASMCSAVRNALPAGDDALATVAKASKACAPLWTWAHASLELADSFHHSGAAAEEMARLLEAHNTEGSKQQEARAAREAARLALQEARMECGLFAEELGKAEAAVKKAESVWRGAIRKAENGGASPRGGKPLVFSASGRTVPS